ncbi:hypothetical protein EDB92DRAFT_1817831 [Lactarius akahatsu]|uniref:Uncharacterized protein n=1 Tax=Lactarius akahatsu TaxID=416441 RepID=A0AAD4LCH3_9AGAM|nr:hypothetical protein EDB92DRAFT_1817831 [Lactarius akahatsu]
MSQTYVLKRRSSLGDSPRRCATKPTKYLRISQQAVLDEFFTGEPPLTEEPYTIGHLSVVDTLDLREGLPQHNPTTSPSSATSNFELPPGRYLQLINSEHIPRYTKNVTVQVTLYSPDSQIIKSLGRPRERTYFEIPPLTTTFLYSPEIGLEQGSLREDCAPWVPATHPDGALYFFDEDRTGGYSGLITTLATKPDMYETGHMISELFAVRSPAHVKHRLEYLYWLGFYVSIDVLLGPIGLSFQPFSRVAVSHLPSTMNSWGSCRMAAWVNLSYRSTLAIRLNRCYHRCDDLKVFNSAIRCWDNAANDQTWSDTGLVYHTASIILFLAPEGHLRELKDVWVDEVIIQENWTNLISGILKEWKQLILLKTFNITRMVPQSTVMLSVNVRFLAVPGVVISNLNNVTSPSQVVIFTSPAQVASCMSIVASAGSIVIGLLLVHRNSTKQNEDPAGADGDISVALLLSCFRNSNISTRISVAVTSLVVIATILWCHTKRLGNLMTMWWCFSVNCDSSSRSPSSLGHAGRVHSMPDREKAGSSSAP